MADKALALVEEDGAERDAYAVKLLQSEGELSIASTGKDPATGRLVTHEYRVTGPVPVERDEPKLADLPRLVFQLNKREHARLRMLINYLHDMWASQRRLTPRQAVTTAPSSQTRSHARSCLSTWSLPRDLSRRGATRGPGRGPRARPLCGALWGGEETVAACTKTRSPGP